MIVITYTYWGLTQALFVFMFWNKEPLNHIPILVFHKFKINLSIHSGRQKLITQIRTFHNLSECVCSAEELLGIFARSRISERHPD